MDEENENTNNINYDMNTIRSNVSQKVKSNYDQPIEQGSVYQRRKNNSMLELPINTNGKRRMECHSMYELSKN